MNEDKKNKILHCYVGVKLSMCTMYITRFYYVSTDNLRFTVNERFDINLTNKNLTKIYEYMNLIYMFWIVSANGIK